MTGRDMAAGTASGTAAGPASGTAPASAATATTGPAIATAPTSGPAVPVGSAATAGSAATGPGIPTGPSPDLVAPLGRLLRSELRWVFRRPRTLVALAMLAALPVAIGTGLALSQEGGPAGGDTLISQAAGNGLVLPIVSLSMAIALLLPLVVSMSAADALAGESAHGTLRGLLLAPVGRIKLVAVKAFGVLTVTAVGVAVIALVGVVAGLLLLGNDQQMLTLSGTSLSTGEALGRIAILSGWAVVQMAAVGAVALAISALTDHPLVVMAVTVGSLIVITVLTAIQALDWLWPVLLPTGWIAVADVMRDPMPWDGLLESGYRAACYLMIGLSLTIARMVTRDA